MKTYFRAIEKFLIQSLDKVSQAVSSLRGTKVSRMDTIKIVAEKHGSDYHPARILIDCGDEVVSLAINVAVTNRGRERMLSECSALAYLAEAYPVLFIPRFFFYGEVLVSSDEGFTSPVCIFAAEWFDGFHEFHLGANPETPQVAALLWDPQRPDTPLGHEELSQIYRQAAYILTYYYDVFTCSEIFPWHHAAGDFVVAKREDCIEVRLITVRQYAPRTVFIDAGLGDPLIGILMFLTNLTLRMRLDRANGTGDIVWAPEQTLSATIMGFMQALQDQTSQGRIDPALFKRIVGFLNSIAPDDLTKAFLAVIHSYSDQAPDLPVVMKNLERHILLVFKALTTLRLSQVCGQGGLDI